MNCLLAGFKGNHNTAKLILDNSSNSIQKLYLENDFNACSEQIRKAVIGGGYDLILALGQKPVIKRVYIETSAQLDGDALSTNYDYTFLSAFLNKQHIKTKISTNAGNYLCNHVYYHGLTAIRQSHAPTHMLFLHVPFLNNAPDITVLAASISSFLETMAIQ